MSIQVKANVPIQAMTQSEVRSTSKHILRRRMVSILPSSQVDYSYSGNNEIKFVISSGSDLWDPSNSYIRADMTCALNLDGSDDTTKALATGGIHSCFDQIEISTSVGAVIERIEEYGRLYALLSQMTQSAEVVDRNEAVAGDSTKFKSYVPEGELTDAFADTASTVGGVANAEYRTVVSSAIGAAGSGDSGSAQVAPTRKKTANTASITLCFRPLLSFLSTGQFIPLSLIRGGLIVKLRMARPVNALQSNQVYTGAGFTGANVTLSNVRYVCDFVTPSEELTSMLVSKYNSTGLTYPILTYRHFMDVNSSASGTIARQLYANLRSARFVVQRIQPASLNTDTNSATDVLNSYEFDSMGTGVKANMSEYQFQSGSYQFPQFKVDVSDIGQWESYVHLQQSLGVYGDAMLSKRFEPYEWTETNSIFGLTESKTFAIGENLSRDASILTGLDLSTTPLEYNQTFDAVFQINSANADRYCHTWIGADALVSISSSGVIIRS